MRSMWVSLMLAPAGSCSRKKWASVSIFLFFFGCTGAVSCLATSRFSSLLQPLVARNDVSPTASSDAPSSVGPPRYRSSYHFQPAKNWMNDPNGPMFYKGKYHLFYQYNPGSPVWGNLTWGHAVSEDLIHWEEVEPALTCDRWYDLGGVWSGSVTIGPDGTPVILYTGVAGDLEETQNIAVPANVSDPYLRKWVKFPENPVLTHPDGVSKEDFRDPTTAWQVADGSWRMTLGAQVETVRDRVETVGAQVETVGMALLYRSDDLLSWELESNVLRAVPDTGMWECLDFFPVGSNGQIGLDTSTRGPSVRHVLKVSSFDRQRDYYAVGFYNGVTEAFTPINRELDVIYGLLYDYGKFYASKSFYDPEKLRRINWGWSNESDTEAQDIAKGWASLLALPRTVWLDSKIGDNLLQAPIEEVKNLRGSKVSKTNLELEPGSIVKIEGSSGGQRRTIFEADSNAEQSWWPRERLLGGVHMLVGTNCRFASCDCQDALYFHNYELLRSRGSLHVQLDVEVVFEYPDVSNVSMDDGRHPDNPFDCSKGGSAQRGIFGPFGLLVMTDDALQEQTAVFFYISQSKDGRWATYFCSDQSRSSLLDGIDRSAFWGNVRVLPSEDLLSLRVLVDHSIIENFVQGGRMVITSRIYPIKAVHKQAHVFLFNNGTSRITVRGIDIWQMEGVWSPEIPFTKKICY